MARRPQGKYSHTSLKRRGLLRLAEQHHPRGMMMLYVLQGGAQPAHAVQYVADKLRSAGPRPRCNGLRHGARSRGAGFCGTLEASSSPTHGPQVRAISRTMYVSWAQIKTPTAGRTRRTVRAASWARHWQQAVYAQVYSSYVP